MISMKLNNAMFLIVDLQVDFASKDGALSVNDGTDAKRILDF